MLLLYLVIDHYQGTTHIVVCGVFLISHMETYKEEDVDKWNVNLDPESEDNHYQHIQLDDPRKKYVTKILTVDVNIRKPTVHNYLQVYGK
ncbi:hypothetical protein LXL04_023309 [Taraxacum kok-saghyz]